MIWPFFFLERMGPSRHIMRNFFLKLPYLDIKFQLVARIQEESYFFLFSSLTCSQIWVSPLVGDSQPTYLTNLKKEHWDHRHEIGV
jgi:hypothetical protein